MKKILLSLVFMAGACSVLSHVAFTKEFIRCSDTSGSIRHIAQVQGMRTVRSWIVGTSTYDIELATNKKFTQSKDLQRNLTVEYLMNPLVISPEKVAVYTAGNRFYLENIRITESTDTDLVRDVVLFCHVSTAQ